MTRAAVIGPTREGDRRGTARDRRPGTPRRPAGGGRSTSERNSVRVAPHPRPLWDDEELAPEVRPMPDRDPREERPRAGGDLPPHEAGGRGPTLGDLVTGAWEGLLSAGSAPCPACGDRMYLYEGSGSCGGCGARLS